MKEILEKDTHDLGLLLGIPSPYKERLGLRHTDVATMVNFVYIKPLLKDLWLDLQLIFANYPVDDGGL